MKSRSLPTGAKYLIGEENGHIYNKFLPDPNSHCNMYFHHHAHLTPTAALQSKHAYKFPTLQMMKKKKKKKTGKVTCSKFKLVKDGLKPKSPH